MPPEPLIRIEARPEARGALEGWLRDHDTLMEAATSQPRAETLQGRGPVSVVPAAVGEGRWVVRHYHRGGAVASLLGDRYLRLGTPRPVREFRLGRAMEERGIPTPTHVAGAVYAAGPWYRGDLVTRLVPGARDLAAVLFPGRALDGGVVPAPAWPAGAGPSPDPVPAMRAAGSLVRLLHDRGVVHRDLNLKNVLIAPGEPGRESEPVRALVLDLDRALLRDRVSKRARQRMLDRFWRSARKWESRTGVRLEPVLRQVFEAGYDGGSAR